MKKLLLAAIGATGLLASCGDLGGSTSATMNTVDFVSDKTLSAPITGSDNKVYAKGTYVICDNMTTNIQANVTYSGTINKVTLQLKGVNTGTTKNVNVYSLLDSDGSLTTDWFALTTGMAPRSLTSQAIVVNPITVTTIKGYTYMRAQANDSSNIVETSYAIPVVDCI